MKLAGKVALVTGGTSGIGLATAKLFAAEGAKVIVNGRNPDKLKNAAAELGPDALVIPASIDRLSDLDELMSAIKARFGGLDILFVNAGIFEPRFIADIDEAFFDAMIATNLKGSFFTFQKALPLLRPGASVIFNTSAMNKIGVPATSLYSGVKAALRSLVRVAATEFSDRGIRVNAVSPGSIITELHQVGDMPVEDRQKIAAQIIDRTPLRRFGEVDDIAKAALFLASDDASYIQGEELVVSGGWSAV